MTYKTTCYRICKDCKRQRLCEDLTEDRCGECWQKIGDEIQEEHIREVANEVKAEVQSDDHSEAT